MYQEHCHFSPNFPQDLKSFSDPNVLVGVNRIIQYPFIPLVIEETTEEDLKRLAEKKREGGKRLQEIAVKQRADKVNSSFPHSLSLFFEEYLTDKEG